MLFTSVYKPPVHICLQTTSLHLFTNHIFTSVKNHLFTLFTNHLFTSVYKPPLYICLQTTSLHQFTNHFIPLCFQPLYIFVYKLPLNICLQTICFKHLFTNTSLHQCKNNSLHLCTNKLCTSVYIKPSLYIMFTNHLFTFVYKPSLYICLQTTSLHLFTNQHFTSVYKPPLNICLQTTFSDFVWKPLHMFMQQVKSCGSTGTQTFCWPCKHYHWATEPFDHPTNNFTH